MTVIVQPEPARVTRVKISPKKPVNPNAPRVGQWTTFFLLALTKIVGEAEKEEGNPEWLNLLFALISGSWENNLNRRYRRRSCECCLIVSRRVRVYFEGPKLGEILDRRGLPGDDTQPRFYGNRLSRAN